MVIFQDLWYSEHQVSFSRVCAHDTGIHISIGLPVFPLSRLNAVLSNHGVAYSVITTS